jgi:hypothetical protein
VAILVFLAVGELFWLLRGFEKSMQEILRTLREISGKLSQ